MAKGKLPPWLAKKGAKGKDSKSEMPMKGKMPKKGCK